MLSLINRSNQSYGRSLMTVDDIVEHAKKNNLPVAALTDIHSLSAAPEFLAKCQKAGIHGVAGVTLMIKEKGFPLGEMVLLGKGNKGFAALRDLIDLTGHIGNDRKFNPKRGVDIETLLSGEYAEKFGACIMLDGFPGSIGEALLKRADLADQNVLTVKAWMDSADSDISKIRKQFGEGDYLGVQTPIAKSVIAQVIALPDVLGGEPGDGVEPKGVLETTLGMAKNQRQLARAKMWFKQYAQSYLSSFGSDKKINKMIDARFKGAILTAGGEGYKVSNHPFLGADYIMERCKTPKIFSNDIISNEIKGEGEMPSLDVIVNRAWDIFKETLPSDKRDAYRERLDRELNTIKKLGFESYFKNIFKIQALSEKENNGFMLRGSAAASLILHVCGLSPVDPIEENLLFERLLDEDRIEDPDVDIEFVRPEGIRQAMAKTFDDGQFAYLSQENGIQKPIALLKLARETMMAFYPNPSEENNQAIEFAFNALAEPLKNPKFKDRAWVKSWDDWKSENAGKKGNPAYERTKNELLEIADEFSKSKLFTGISAGSMVIIPEGVGRYFNQMEAYQDKNIGDGLKRIAQSKRNLPATGHIKYDFLSNRSFARTINALDALGLPRDMRIKGDDPVVRAVFTRNAFMGVNQVSGRFGSQLAEKFQPNSFSELTALNALIRDEEIIDQYINNRNSEGKNEIDPVILPYLRETDGFLIYEEQLINLLQHVGGVSFGEADRVRSQLKKGNAQPIDDMQATFVNNAMKKFGVTQEKATEWYAPILAKKGSFVFNKAHSSTYAHLALTQCWIKSHYPAHYAAEMFMEKELKFKDVKQTLPDILGDWAKMHPNAKKSPQNAIDFIMAVRGVLKREEKDPDSNAKRNPDNIRMTIDNVIDNGSFDFIIPPGQTREDFKAQNRTLMNELLDVDGYAPVSHDKKGNIGMALYGNKNGAGAQAMQRLYNDVVPRETGTDIPPINRRTDASGKDVNIDWSEKVMLGHFVAFLYNEGIVQGLDVDLTKARSLDHLRFQIKDEQGNSHDYHIASISTDPIRASTRDTKYSITSGLHQGSKRDKKPTKTLQFAMEVAKITGMGGLNKKFEFKPGFNPGDYWVKDSKGNGGRAVKQTGPFLRALNQFVRGAKSPMHDIDSAGILTTFVPCQPTSPVMIEISDSTRQYGMNKMLPQLFQESRYIDVSKIQDQFANGNYSVAETRQDNYQEPRKAGDSAHPRYTQILANYQRVDDKTPLYALPLIEKNQISPGGHQRFLTDKKKTPWKTTKMDLGFTTRRVVAHVCGKTVPDSETLWLCEAALDSLSFNELQDDIAQLNQTSGTQHNVTEKNSVSVKNAGGAARVLHAMLGIHVDKTAPKGQPMSLDFYRSETFRECDPLSDEQTGTCYQWFKMQEKIHFLKEDSPENQEAEEKLMATLHAVGFDDDEIQKKLVVHYANPQQSFNQNVNRVYDGIQGEAEIFLHNSNMETWLRGSDMYVEKGVDGEYEVGRVVVREEQVGQKYSEMSPAQKDAFKALLVDKFKRISGASSLGLALDNDGAGRTDAIEVRLLCLEIGLPVGFLMPKGRELDLTLGGKMEKGVKLKDHNDYLTLIRRLQQDGQPEKATEILNEYASYSKPARIQKPKERAPAPIKDAPLHDTSAVKVH